MMLKSQILLLNKNQRLSKTLHRDFDFSLIRCFSFHLHHQALSQSNCLINKLKCLPILIYLNISLISFSSNIKFQGQLMRYTFLSACRIPFQQLQTFNLAGLFPSSFAHPYFSLFNLNLFNLYNFYLMSVKVAVRVRPFNEREKKLNSQCVVKMQDQSTILKASSKEEEKKFTFDYSFWSFDGFQEQPNGYLKAAPGSKYADQQYVFKEVGQKVLDNAFQGYHCCLFAYGQTGSGKSYSMIGYKENKGIVPITCEQLFNRFKDKKEGQTFEVTASMMEIYNEQVQDLTVDTTQRPQGGLKVRQNKLLGIYIDGIKKNLVQSYEQIQKMMDLGTKNRTIASTQMNATSSRAHTIISIEFRQKKKTGATTMEKVSVINLVDLAGSQRQSKTGASGDRLKQGIGINLSLTTLGQVISALAQNASGGKKFVPYRDSCLTRILTNALGGNSQTIMICALSPASDNYQQTLSTLRYADQAKKIKNKPVVNESQTDKIIRQLKAQNEKLKKLLEEKEKGIQNNPNQTQNQTTNQTAQEQKKVEPDVDELEELEANLNALKNKIDGESKTIDEKRKQQQAQKEQEKKKAQQNRQGQQKILDEAELKKLEKKNAKVPPHFENISRDLIINKKLKILLEKKTISIGKAGCKPSNQIIFGGRDMKPKHAKIQIDEAGNVNLSPVAENCHLYLNGAKVTSKVVLKNLDRVIFGWNSVYLFKDKDHERPENSKLNEDYITWDFIKNEVEELIDIDQSDTQTGGGCCSIF